MGVTVQQPAAGPARAGRTPRDIVLSLLALVVPLLLLAGGYKLLFNGDHPFAVDPGGSYAAARAAGAFPVQQPRGLPAGWTVASAAYTTEAGAGLLRIGYVAPGGGGAQVIQSNRAPDQLLPRELGATAAPAGLRAIGTRRWQWYPSARGGAALVAVDDSRTTVVIGTASPDELVALAAALA